jgi:hypothetical protein
MSRRQYSASIQAALAQRMRERRHPAWDEFKRLWPAFNALYNVAQARTEKYRVIGTVQRFLSANQAAAILAQVGSEAQAICSPPPGDMRYDETSPKFRRESNRHAAVVEDATASPVDRVAHLAALIYQVRCNLIHGSKDPDIARDLDLVRWSNPVLELLVPAVEGAMAQVP